MPQWRRRCLWSSAGLGIQERHIGGVMDGLHAIQGRCGPASMRGGKGHDQDADPWRRRRGTPLHTSPLTLYATPQRLHVIEHTRHVAPCASSSTGMTAPIQRIDPPQTSRSRRRRRSTSAGDPLSSTVAPPFPSCRSNRVPPPPSKMNLGGSEERRRGGGREGMRWKPWAEGM